MAKEKNDIAEEEAIAEKMIEKEIEKEIIAPMKEMSRQEKFKIRFWIPGSSPRMT